MGNAAAIRRLYVQERHEVDLWDVTAGPNDPFPARQSMRKDHA
jgi:hypothetical protein